MRRRRARDGFAAAGRALRGRAKSRLQKWMDPKVIAAIVLVVILIILVIWASMKSSQTCPRGFAPGDTNISGSKSWLQEPATPETLVASEMPRGRQQQQQPQPGRPEANSHTETAQVRSPLYPLRQILDQLALVQDHCIWRRRCYECLAKHMMMLEAWADFGAALVGSATDDYAKIAQVASDKLTEARRLGVVKSGLAAWAAGLSARIREAYPDLELSYDQLDAAEVPEEQTALLPLRLPFFNLREVCKLLQMMESTCAHPEMRCLECLRLHAAKAVAFAREGAEMSPELRREYEGTRRGIETQARRILRDGINEQDSQWFRAERKRLHEAYPELHEQGLYKQYEKPVYLATCGETCS